MKKNLTRAEIAQAVFEDLGLSFRESEKLVDSLFKEIMQTLTFGESVKLSSFGTFSVKTKKARVGRNPKTGVEYPIKTRRTIRFTPSVTLKKSVQNVSVTEEGES